MKCLVTGGVGFCGSNLVLELINQGHDTIVTDNLFSANMGNLESKMERFVYWDCSEEKKFNDKIDVIFHQAAITDPRYEKDEETYFKNVEGFKNVINLAQEHNASLIYASSASMYGNGASPQREDQEKDLQSAYARSKLRMDEIAFELLDQMHIVGLRYFNVFGPKESHKGRPSSMIYHLRNQMINGQRPRLFKYGKQIRDHIYVKDVIRANILALDAPSGVYNVGTGIGITFNDVVDTLNRVLNTNYEIEYIDNPYSPESYQSHTQADTSLAKKKLGFEAIWGFEDAVADYHDYLLKIK